MIEISSSTDRASGRVPTSVIAVLVALVVALVLACWTLGRLVEVIRTTWPEHGGPVTIDEVLGGVLAGLSLIVGTWLVIGLGLTLLAHLPGALGHLAGRAVQAVTPLALRKLAALLLGTSLGTVLLPPTPASGGGQAWALASAVRSDVPGPAFSATAPDAHPAFRPTASPVPGPTVTSPPPVPVFTATVAQTTPSVPRTSWLPTRPPKAHDGRGTDLLTPAPRTASASLQTVTVRRGDTLWSIAARHLGSAATDAEIARAWPRWHAANRDLIGPDPHLVLPGQQLVPPTEGLS